MANTLTGLIPTLYEDLDTISREMVGFLPAVAMDSAAERAAVGQVITSPVVPAGTAINLVAAATPPQPADRTLAPINVTLTKARAVPFYFTGEDTKGLSMNFGTSVRNSFLQAVRTLVNEIEVDLFLAAKGGASRAYGTAGTTPFPTAADMTDLAQLALILDNNGCPIGDRHVVLNTVAKASLAAKQANLFNSGPDLLRRGILTELEGFNVHVSGGITTHTKGGGSAYVTSGSTAPGVTDIALVTGSGTVLAGDVVTFAADANNKYVINTGVAAPGTISLGKPGAIVTIATANAMTIGNNYTGNFGFDRNAIWLAMRAWAMPEGGDLADDAIMIADPVSGLVFEVREYAGFGQRSYFVCAVWGTAAVKSAHIATLLG